MRIQYYTPEGEKLPVALKHSHYDIPVDKVVGMFDDNNFETERLRATPINSAPNRRHFLYASDFTEEELKDLVDERQVDISKPTYKDGKQITIDEVRIGETKTMVFDGKDLVDEKDI